LTGWGRPCLARADHVLRASGRSRCGKSRGRAANPVGSAGGRGCGRAVRVPHGAPGPFGSTALYLALASLAFAVIGETLLFSQPEIFGLGPAASSSGRPVLGLDLNNQRTLLLVTTAIFGAFDRRRLSRLRRGRFGRRPDRIARQRSGVRGRFGVNPIVTKLAVFGLSAGMAGFRRWTARAAAHVRVGHRLRHARGACRCSSSWWPAASRSPAAPCSAGSCPWPCLMVHDWWHISALNAIEVLGPGLLALGVVNGPDGAVVEIGRSIEALLPWRRKKVRGPPPRPAATDATTGGASMPESKARRRRGRATPDGRSDLT